VDTTVCSTCKPYKQVTFRKVTQTEGSWRQHHNIPFLEIHMKKACRGVGQCARQARERGREGNRSKACTVLNRINHKIKVIMF